MKKDDKLEAFLRKEDIMNQANFICGKCLNSLINAIQDKAEYEVLETLAEKSLELNKLAFSSDILIPTELIEGFSPKDIEKYFKDRIVKNDEQKESCSILKDTIASLVKKELNKQMKSKKRSGADD